jgi:hypothetical protein
MKENEENDSLSSTEEDLNICLLPTREKSQHYGE